MPNNKSGHFLGIDIAKASLDVTLWQAGHSHYEHFANSEAGIKQLCQWLRKQHVRNLHVCMEATNVYWEAAAQALDAAGYRVSVVNPRRIKGFAMSQMQRNKTDKVDSEVIVAFCAALEPDAWQPPNATQRKLRALEGHRQDLRQSLVREKNRRDTVRDEDVKASLQRVIELLQEELKVVEQQLAETADQCEVVSQQKQLLLTIQGIGLKSAHMLLALFYDMASYKNARAVAADAGVTPSHHESGSSVHKRPKISKVGKAAVRGELHMPALNAMRTNPILRDFAERLRAKGRPEPVIIGAVIRKLLHICYGVLKHQTPFDPNYGRVPQAT
jgi:transposase